MFNSWTNDKFADSEELVKQIIEDSKSKLYKKGEVIYRQGEISDQMYLLLEGRVEVNFVNDDGRKKILSIHEPRCFMGEFSIDKRPNLLTAQCLTPVKVATINLNKIYKWNNDVLFAFISSLSGKLRNVVENIANQTFNDIDERVKDLIIGLAKGFGKKTAEGIVIELPITHQMIADMVGSSRVRVSQIIADMNKKSEISSYGRKIVVKDLDQH